MRHFVVTYNKFSDQYQSKALADGKLNVIEKMKFILGKVENIVEKGKNTGCQIHILDFGHGSINFLRVIPHSTRSHPTVLSQSSVDYHAECKEHQEC